MSGKKIRQQFADTMLEVGRSDPRLVVMVGDISHHLLKPFARECPDRFYNAGILEPTIVSMGAGLSRSGLTPVLHTIAPFLIERSFEQIKLDFCYHRLAGNIVTVGSAFDYAYLGCTHHCYGDFALLKTLEGVQITYPASPKEFDLLFKSGYRNEFLTVYRIPEAQHDIEFTSEELQIGRGLKVSDGQHITFIATGPQLRTAIRARELLLSRGITSDVIYIHSIRPLDAKLIFASSDKTRRVVVLEEHMQSGGLGDDVLRLIVGIQHIQFLSISIPDIFVRRHASYDDHCEQLGLTHQRVFESVLKHFNFSR
jgi:transketolase